VPEVSRLLTGSDRQPIQGLARRYRANQQYPESQGRPSPTSPQCSSGRKTRGHGDRLDPHRPARLAAARFHARSGRAGRTPGGVIRVGAGA
ncbi:MAG TPA: hypothetical protein VLU24_11665, partial [Mycobacterium sp.]|nr:hypothetical protein [Mycobacterium sp.]